MSFSKESKDYNNYSYKLDTSHGNDETKVSYKIEPAKEGISKINLMDYLGLNNRHANIYNADSSFDSMDVFLGKGIVDGKEVYAKACYNIYPSDTKPFFKNVILYEICDDSIVLIGEIRNGKVEYRTDFTSIKLPLIMEVNQEYNYSIIYTDLGAYSSSYYKVLGFKNVIVNGKHFNSCIELRKIQEHIFKSGAGGVMISTNYYSKGLGLVLAKLTDVFISSNSDKYISVSQENIKLFKLNKAAKIFQSLA